MLSMTVGTWYALRLSLLLAMLGGSYKALPMSGIFSISTETGTNIHRGLEIFINKEIIKKNFLMLLATRKKSLLLLCPEISLL